MNIIIRYCCYPPAFFGSARSNTTIYRNKKKINKKKNSIKYINYSFPNTPIFICFAIFVNADPN